MDHVYNPDGSLSTTSRQYRNAFWPEEHEGFQHYITYDRDGMGRATGVNFDGDGNNIPAGGLSLVSGADYYPSGALTGFDYGNGQSFSQLLNERLQPASLTSVKSGGETALELSYLYNARGLITHQTDGVDPTNSREYLYDGQGRLTEATGPWGAGLFDYDALGNILSKQLGARQIAMTYNSQNRVTKSTDTGETGTRNLGYDDRGNVTSIGGLNMHYDATDRPTGLSGDATGSYRYDGHGRRVKSITVHDDNTKTIRFNVYDAGGALIYVVQLAPGTDDDHITNYIKMDGRTVARVKSVGTRLNYEDEMTYLHHDHLGSAVAGTDANGDVLWTEKYTPFGIALVNYAANDNQAGFTGHLKDTDTGLTYMQARYYDPVIGRFLSHDPVQFSVERPLMFNRYGYTFNNPINAVDPDGRETYRLTRTILNDESRQAAYEVLMEMKFQSDKWFHGKKSEAVANSSHAFFVTTVPGTKLEEGQILKISSQGPEHGFDLSTIDVGLGIGNDYGFGTVAETESVERNDEAIVNKFIHAGKSVGVLKDADGLYTSTEVIGISNEETAEILNSFNTNGTPYFPVPRFAPGSANSNTRPQRAFLEMTKRGYSWNTGRWWFDMTATYVPYGVDEDGE